MVLEAYSLVSNTPPRMLVNARESEHAEHLKLRGLAGGHAGWSHVHTHLHTLGDPPSGQQEGVPDGLPLLCFTQKVRVSRFSIL